jgi:hypothetical protein
MGMDLTNNMQSLRLPTELQGKNAVARVRITMVFPTPGLCNGIFSRRGVEFPNKNNAIIVAVMPLSAGFSPRP